MPCLDCKYRVAVEGAPDLSCGRHPPQLVFAPGIGPITGFPQVAPNLTCGEHDPGDGEPLFTQIPQRISRLSN